MAGRIATISGTMLTPGVSRNRRLYTPELIARAAGRMAERIADPGGLPIVMRTHHEAGDDSVRIVGRLTGVKIGEDGAARYTADLYDTAHGRDIASLVVPGKDAAPALKSVSIHGYWIGPVKTVTHDGESVTTGDDLEIDAVDFTGTPGVLGATVDDATWVRPASTGESASGRTPISESAQATVEAVTEDAPVEAYSAKQKRAMLAKGQAMKNDAGEPAYPIKSKRDLRRAIRAVGRGGADHDKVRAHIIARAAALGLAALIPDNWNKDGSMKETSPTRYSDVREYYDGPGGAAGFCIDAYNGPTSVTIRNCSLDPAELRVVAAAAMDAIVNALQAVDPDMDGDVDVPGAPNADTDDDMGAPAEGGVTPDDDMETALPAGQPVAETIPTALPLTSPAAPVGETTTHQEVPAVSEPQTPAAETASTPTLAPVIQLTQEQFTQLLATVAPARETAPPTPAQTAETVEPQQVAAKAAAKETKEQRKAEKKALAEAAAADRDALKTQIRDELRAELLKENGLPPRQGFRVHENDKAGPAEDIEAQFADRANALLGNYGLMQPAQ